MAIEVMDRKEMKKQTNALHIDVREGKLYVWGVVNQQVCIYPEVFTLADPDGAPISGTFTLPPSPPAEMPPVDPSIAGYADAVGRPPIVLGPCTLFPLEEGKKKANSCVGCTTGCRGKNKQELPQPGSAEYEATVGNEHHPPDPDDDEGDEEDNASASE